MNIIIFNALFIEINLLQSDTAPLSKVSTTGCIKTVTNNNFNAWKRLYELFLKCAKCIGTFNNTSIKMVKNKMASSTRPNVNFDHLCYEHTCTNEFVFYVAITYNIAQTKFLEIVKIILSKKEKKVSERVCWIKLLQVFYTAISISINFIG